VLILVLVFRPSGLMGEKVASGHEPATSRYFPLTPALSRAGEGSVEGAAGAVMGWREHRVRLRRGKSDDGAGMMDWMRLRHDPRFAWVGIVLIAAALALLPFLIGRNFGNSWCGSSTSPFCTSCWRSASTLWWASRLLDLGYIAFYAVGAYVYALLSSPHLATAFPDLFPQGVHLPVWVILPLGATVAGIFGVLLGAPTLRLRATISPSSRSASARSSASS